MGVVAREVRRGKRPVPRKTRLTVVEQRFLQENARYEGSPLHKRNPGDFGLTPPVDPRKDRTLCDEAGVVTIAAASDLFARAIERGLVSEAFVADGYPKRMWVVDKDRVFEVMYGGSREGAYHGYPVRTSNPWFEDVVEAWEKP